MQCIAAPRQKGGSKMQNSEQVMPGLTMYIHHTSANASALTTAGEK